MASIVNAVTQGKTWDEYLAAWIYGPASIWTAQVARPDQFMLTSSTGLRIDIRGRIDYEHKSLSFVTMDLSSVISSMTITQYGTEVVSFQDMEIRFSELMTRDGMWLTNAWSYTGSNVDELISGGNLADRLTGLGGDDVFDPGRGRDVVDGGEGADAVRYLGENAVQVNLFRGFAVDGGGDRDALVSIESVAGSSGDDVIFGNGADNIVLGERGADAIVLRAGDDIALGGAGDDVISGRVGDDMIYGNGDQTTGLGADNDTLYGGAGADLLSGEEGDDALFGQADDDDLQGGAGDDLMSGGGGGDTMVGDAGADRMFGGGGNDVLRGGDGDDLVVGAGGDDVISGGRGDDLMSGGAGADVFVFDGASSGADRIRGFQDGVDRFEVDFSLAVSFDDVTVSQIGADAELTFVRDGGATVVTLERTDAALIDASDFGFGSSGVDLF